MATFVLLHGHFHGGWCWRDVRPLLRARGHEVFAPSLAGMGERAHAAAPDMGLLRHVEEVAALLFMEDLREVVLVGHSYGGAVAAGVAQCHPERIGHLALLDAPLLQPGQSLYDARPDLRPIADQIRLADGWRLGVLDPAAWGITEPTLKAWTRERLVPVVEATLEDRLPPVPAWQGHRTYLACTRSAMFQDAHAATRRDRTWRFVALDADHDVMLTHPALLAEHLLALA